MYKSKVMTCVTLLVMIAILIGIFCYASYVREDEKSNKGTLVNAFDQKVVEVSL